MVLPGGLPDALAGSETASTPIEPPPAAPPSPNPPKRPRGRPRTIKTPVEGTLVQLVPTAQPSKSVASGTKPAPESIKSTNWDLDATRVIKIDKSTLYLFRGPPPPGQGSLKVCRSAAVSAVRAQSFRSPPPTFRSAARNGTQNQRRVRGSPMQNAPPAKSSGGQ
jgi:hypothetical protein